MRRRMTAIVLAAALAGGVAATVAPAAQAAGITCDVAKLHKEADTLKREAARQKSQGQREAARRTLDRASQIEKRIHQCEAADRNTSGPFGG
ncbi:MULTISPECIES: hypothetical protein [Streptomyces]|uniref:DUF1090 domain-containing protein n=1 Tax=Streptomyces luteosporeus TaxID=173856 RepID=A0ABN3TVT8_9ACTN